MTQGGLPPITFVPRITRSDRLCDETDSKCYVQLVKEEGTTERRRQNSIGRRMWRPVGKIVTLSCISYGFLAQHLLNTLTAFKAGKNWKSAGAAVGASLCQLADILFALDNASRGSLIDINFHGFG